MTKKGEPHGCRRPVFPPLPDVWVNDKIHCFSFKKMVPALLLFHTTKGAVFLLCFLPPLLKKLLFICLQCVPFVPVFLFVCLFKHPISLS